MDRAHKRTYTSLRIHALRHNGFLKASEMDSLNMPTTPEILDEVLLYLQAERKIRVSHLENGDTLYDFLPFLEEAIEESVLDMPTRLHLAKIYLERSLWTSAITELRMTRTHPKLKKESLYLLGTCFEEKGAYEKAREQYERVLALDYFFRDTLDRLTNISDRRQQHTVISSSTTVVTAQEELSSLSQDRYEIVRELGRGGAGVVYQAIDLKLKRDVALKVLYPYMNQGEGEAATFLQEARLAAQLDHPNIIDIYDVNLESRFIAMEFVDGGTLRDVLNTYKQLSIEQARTVIVQLCKGLQVAHTAGVLHRDIKPANIFVTRQKKIKLGDFGIAHIAKLDQNAFTQLSTQIGTLPYMSPEQVQGKTVRIPSDIYAAGIVFYEMLTGKPPFMQGDISYHHLHSQPELPGISPEIDAVVLRCLEKHPAKRFQSVEQLRKTLCKMEKEEKERIKKYRELLTMASVDKEISKEELIVLKLQRKKLHLSDEEAHNVEQELGLKLPAE